MKIRYGSSRVVLVVGGLVFKFPRFVQLWRILLVTLKYLPKRQVDHWRLNAGQGMIYFVGGLLANLTEYSVSLYLTSPVLAPDYFSCGFVSVQKYVEGEQPSYSELVRCWKRLPVKVYEAMQLANLHSWDPGNFRRTPNGIVMIDYGDNILSGHLSLSSFLVRHSEEMESVLLSNQSLTN